MLLAALQLKSRIHYNVVEHLRSISLYDERTGECTWKEKRTRIEAFCNTIEAKRVGSTCDHHFRGHGRF